MKKEQVMFRAQVPAEAARLVRLVAGVSGMSLGEILTAAVTLWLQSPEIQEIIKKHNLEKAP